jgi:hypothetical protein
MVTVRKPMWPAAIVGFLLLATLGGAAQTGRANTNTAQAVLHIHVVVVPTLYSLPPKTEESKAASVSYLIPHVRSQQEIIIQDQALDETQWRTLCAAGTCSPTLRTTTIVAK